MLVSTWKTCVTSLTLAALTVAANGGGHDMMLAAGLAAIRGVWAGILAAARRLGEGGVDDRSAPVDLVGAIEFGQQDSMELLPDPGLIPLAQVVAAGLATAAAQFGGQVVPGDAGLEDEQDAGEDLALVQGFAAGETETASGRWRQEGLEPLPECIGNEQFHDNSSFGS
jgi:hypothetical protein